MSHDALLKTVEEKTCALYASVPHPLPFHGWHHILFVRKHAIRFASELVADPFLVDIAALTHDFNYVAKANSDTAHGQELRTALLTECGLDTHTIDTIETIIQEADIIGRRADISNEAKALSDGDTLFKALPITPILLARLFIEEKKSSLTKLAHGVVDNQSALMDDDLYFYSASARQYLPWARTNLALWKHVTEYLADDTVRIDHFDLPEIDALL